MDLPLGCGRKAEAPPTPFCAVVASPSPLPLNSLPVCQESLKGVWSVWAGEKGPLLASFVGKGARWAFTWLSGSSCSHGDPFRRDSGSQPSSPSSLLGLRFTCRPASGPFQSCWDSLGKRRGLPNPATPRALLSYVPWSGRTRATWHQSGKGRG